MTTALLVIDVQQGMFDSDPPIHNGPELISHINQAIQKAREESFPIIFIQHNGPEASPLQKGTPGWSIHPEMPHAKITIEKHTPDSFYQTELQNKLNEWNVNHLVLSGIQTEACVDTTCRRAFAEGYQVTLLTDAHSTFDKDEISAVQIKNHHNQVLRWFSDTLSVQEWVGQPAACRWPSS